MSAPPDDNVADDLVAMAAALLERCRVAGLRVATAESCTGGQIAATLTEVPGSSDVVDRGFVTYSNAAKTEMLGVGAALIERRGAVSGEVAEAMAVGVLAHAPVDLAVSVTGVAGPGGGTVQKPVGLVYLCGLRRGAQGQPPKLQALELRLGDTGRRAIRLESVRKALELLDILI
ncbi:MAG: CinA family protein [Alphaproteobacteria bacterium]